MTNRDKEPEKFVVTGDIGSEVTVVGQTGDTGQAGPPGLSSKEEITVLVAAIANLTDHMSELAGSMRDLAASFSRSSEATIDRVKAALHLNKISTTIGALVFLENVAIVILVIFLFGQANTTHREVSAIHATQKVNTGITKAQAAQTNTDNQILKQVLSVTNPAAEKAQANAFVALLNHQASCLANHGDRTKESLANQPLKPLMKGCNLDGS